MTVKKWISISVDGQRAEDFEIDVHVSAEDVARIYCEDGDSRAAMFDVLNNCASALRAINDSVIDTLQGKQLEITANFLQEQCIRYAPRPAADATVHELKTHPGYFSLVQSGAKPFEVRKDDRPFAVGDVLLLKEYDPDTGYSGRELRRLVTYLMRTPQSYIPKGHCIMGIRPFAPAIAEPQEVTADGS